MNVGKFTRPISTNVGLMAKKFVSEFGDEEEELPENVHEHSGKQNDRFIHISIIDYL
jgi:hypothetical protein